MDAHYIHPSLFYPQLLHVTSYKSGSRAARPRREQVAPNAPRGRRQTRCSCTPHLGAPLLILHAGHLKRFVRVKIEEHVCMSTCGHLICTYFILWVA